jgi:hypothetical protein
MEEFRMDLRPTHRNENRSESARVRSSVRGTAKIVATLDEVIPWKSLVWDASRATTLPTRMDARHRLVQNTSNNRKVRCHRSNWAPLFGQGKIVVRSSGNFFFGDSLDGFFSLLITPLPEFENVFQIYPPVGPYPMEGEFLIIEESDKKLA